MISQKLREFLDNHGIRYITLIHSPAYTAQAVAHSAHVSGNELAKTVIVRIDGHLAMAVLAAAQKVNTDALRLAAGAASVAVADESDFADAFPGCDLGAMPPFGNLWDIPVFVDERLAGTEHITFNAGSHTELIQMGYEDFADLVKPTVANLTRPTAPGLDLVTDRHR